MTLNKIAFVDIETTGSSVRYDRVIEIGVVKVEENKIAETYSSLINPQCYISPFIEEMTGIKSEELENAPLFETVAYKVYELLEGSIFVAHNVRFDFGFLKNEFKRVGLPFSPKHFCSVRLSRQLFPQYSQHNLDSIIERFGIACERRHRAYDDAKAVFDFFQIVQNTVPKETLSSHLKILLKKPALPKHLSEDSIKNLPESPGVYIFYADNNIPLYVGKSIDVKERVLSHFTNDHTSSKEMSMCQQIVRIETIPTAGELGALLTESRLIKELQPVYNRQLRDHRKLWILKQKKNKKGYFETVFECTDIIDVNRLKDIVAVFRTKRQMKEHLHLLAKEHNLCEKLLGIDTTGNSCFAAKLGLCFGACTNKELPIKYNIRFVEAFSKTKIKNWPFKGPVLINEEDEFSNSKESFILDKWCLIGMMKHGEDGPLENINADEIFFDYDTYKILVKYVLNEKNARKVKNYNKKVFYSPWNSPNRSLNGTLGSTN